MKITNNTWTQSHILLTFYPIYFIVLSICLIYFCLIHLRETKIPYPFIPNYFRVYFLRLEIFLYLIIVWLSDLVYLILIPYFYLNYRSTCFLFLSVDGGMSSIEFFPFCNTGSRLGLGIAFSCVSLTSFDQKCFQNLSFFFFFLTLRFLKNTAPHPTPF